MAIALRCEMVMLLLFFRITIPAYTSYQTESSIINIRKYFKKIKCTMFYSEKPIEQSTLIFIALEITVKPWLIKKTLF